MAGHFNKKILLGIVAALVVIAALLFFIFGGQSETPSDGLSSAGESPIGDTLGRDLLTLLARLRSTELNTALFTDPLFASLQDFGVAIAPQPVGRRNPFADFGGSALAPKSGNKPATGAKKPPNGNAAQQGTGSPNAEIGIFDFSF